VAACDTGADGSGPPTQETGRLPVPTNGAPAPAAAGELATEEAAAGSIIDQEFAYGATEERNLSGFFAMPQDVTEPLPGVILIHEWWGLNDEIKTMARRLAGEGYAVLAVDLFNGAVADSPADAQLLRTDVMRDRVAALDNIGQGVNYLRSYALAPTIAVLGFGLGGGLAFETGLAMPDQVTAVISYYGQLVLDRSEIETLRPPLLGVFAENDESIPVRDVQRFRTLLQDLKKSGNIFIHADTAHGFADSSRSSYDSEEADKAWRETIDFLADHLGSAATSE